MLWGFLKLPKKHIQIFIIIKLSEDILCQHLIKKLKIGGNKKGSAPNADP